MHAVFHICRVSGPFFRLAWDLLRSTLKVFSLALAGTWVFFLGYIPPFRWFHIPYDLAEYHYSLASYAFLSVKAFRLPLWDPLVYSGMSFAANVQSAFYYPGTWIMFLSTWARDRLSYQALQDLDLAHVALAFTLSYLWLSRRRLAPMAAVCGALVYAFGGYLCAQLQHLGLVVAYAWMPLGFLGIDDMSERRSWWPAWKVSLAAAMAFLGGYPPSWVVFAISAGTYALAGSWRWRAAIGTVAAFSFSLAICAVQVLPSWEATHLREPEIRYGAGIHDFIFFVSYLAPNYFDFGLNMPAETNPGREYLHLGAPGILGVAMAFSARWRRIFPAVAVTVVSLLLASNPFDLIGSIVRRSAFLADVLRDYYFLAGVSAGLAAIAAYGIDAFLSRVAKPSPAWMKGIAILSMIIWAVYELIRWPDSFATGPASLADSGMTLAIFTFALLVYRGTPAGRRAWMAATLIVFVGIDYKVFGTGKRFNTRQGSGPIYSSAEFGAMDPEAYEVLKRASDFRVVLQDFGPFPEVARHVGWSTVQGFDPLLSGPYRELGSHLGEWITDRKLVLNPSRPGVMEPYGARFAITGPNSETFENNPLFQKVGNDKSYYKVFEYLNAKPIYQFTEPVEVQKRDPEHRVLRATSEEGGLLTFSESAYPGWSAKLDGNSLAIEPWQIAFQSVRVPPGAHTVEFIYRERLLPLGAAISLVSLALLVWWAVAARRHGGGQATEFQRLQRQPESL